MERRRRKMIEGKREVRGDRETLRSRRKRREN